MQISLNASDRKELVLGIDLGTTNSLAAFIHPVDGAKVVRDRQKRVLCPSVVSVTPDGRVIVGQEAIPYAVTNPAGTVFSVKRFMGRGIDDVEAEELPYALTNAEGSSLVALDLHGKLWTPQELSARILLEIKRRVERVSGMSVNRVVITVPAYFDDAQRQATRDAARMVGLEVLRIINEPTAAALAYGIDNKSKATVVVYDLGGGTFDVSVLKLQDRIFKVVASTGDTALGGDDLDRALVGWVLGTVDAETRSAVEAAPSSLALLKLACERLKRDLTDAEQGDLGVRLPAVEGGHGELVIQQSLTRDAFDALIQPIVARTLKHIENALDDADLDPEDIDDVVCVGGSTRVPLVRSELARYFEKAPHTELHPDHVVALGAALQAQQLAGEAEEELVLLDVTPLSLGIETYGGGVSKLILRNSSIPCRSSEGFTTQKDDQTAVAIHILQGEREMARDLRSLGRFKLTGIPPMRAGMPRVLVEFAINADGILKVTAKEMTSGVMASIEVTPTYGLTDDQVEEMIIDSIEHAHEDITAHRVADLKAELESTITHGVRSLADWGHVVDEPTQTAIRARMELARGTVQDSTDLDEHNRALEELNELYAPIAEAMMNEVLRATVTNRTVEQVLISEDSGQPAADVQLS